MPARLRPCPMLSVVMPALAVLLVPSASPVWAQQADVFAPLPVAECQQLKAVAEKTLGTTFALTPAAPFSFLREDGNPDEPDTGKGCTLTAQGTGNDFPDGPGPTDLKLQQALKDWAAITDNSWYAGYGCMGGSSAMTKGDAVLLIEAGWEPTPEAAAQAQAQNIEDGCMEHLRPEQRRYTVELHAARRK